MRAAKVLALTIACLSGAAGVPLSHVHVLGAPLSALDFVATAHAEPGHDSGEADDTSDVPSAPDPAHPEAAKSAPLPAFVPKPHTLSRSDTGEAAGEDPEGSAPPLDPVAAPQLKARRRAPFLSRLHQSALQRRPSRRQRRVRFRSRSSLFPGPSHGRRRHLSGRSSSARRRCSARPRFRRRWKRAQSAVIRADVFRALCRFRSMVRRGRRCACRAIGTGAIRS